MEKLVLNIREIFEDDHINTEEVRRVLENYKSNPADWKKYAHFDPHKYTRNLVDIGNGKFNLLILCWGPGTGSSIHDHTDSHCFVKVLQGSLLETRYNWPTYEEGQEKDSEEEAKPMVETGCDTYTTNGVTYISDKIGLHRMENPSHSDPAITLHLYIPPFDHCQVFDQRTGRSAKSLVTFYTKYGEKKIPKHLKASKFGRSSNKESALESSESSSEGSSESIFVGGLYCPDSIFENVTSSYIFSPGFPDDYPDNRDCIYKIKVPEGNLVNLVFYAFNLLSECCDSVKIYDGDSTNRNDRIKKVKGNMVSSVPAIRTKNSNVMTVNFISDMQNHGKGFYARFDAVPLSNTTPSNSKCPQRVYDAPFGVIISPKWPNLYQNQASCEYHIKVPEGQQVELYFNFFDTERRWDHLSVYDGDNFTDTKLMTYSGHQKNGTSLKSSGSNMLLYFRSNTSVQRKGFSITYSAV
uniref:cysteine dioxygenase n=1 Tax=Ditylenchus dipsaci TaxID=166011 RepID=A0A915E526_9BILA